MASPQAYHFKLPTYQGPALPEPPFSWYPGVHQHYPHCTSDRMLHSDGLVRTFVIHATAGSSSSGAMSVLFNHSASWHWLIPSENETAHTHNVWACAPERRAAWHVRNNCSHPDVNHGSRYTNYSSLGVEIVNTQQNDPFSQWQVEQAAALVRYAWSKYPTLIDVVSHAKLDPDRRSDPGTEFPWEEFREMVLAAPTDLAQQFVGTTGLPMSVIGPDGDPIRCEARSIDGVIMVEARALIEALGFSVAITDLLNSDSEFDESSATEITIRPRPRRSTRVTTTRPAVSGRSKKGSTGRRRASTAK